MRVWVLILLFIALAISPALANAQACSPPSTGDWLVNESVTCSGETIVLNGNLLVRGLGDLTLEDSELRLNSTSDGEYGIVVNSSLHVLGSTIESLSKPYTFVSDPGARLEIRDSFIHDCGYLGGTLDLRKGGLYVGSDGSNITNTTFTDNYIALLIYSKDNRIANNKILSNTGSFSVNGSGNVMTRNVIKHNPLFGYGIKGENLIFEHNVIENNSGISFITKNSVINNNSFFNNTVWGLTVSGDNNNVTNNRIRSNTVSTPGSTCIGLSIADSGNTRVVGNTILENGIGLKLYQAANTLLKDNLCNRSGVYDIYLLSSENITFENTDYAILVKSWHLDVKVVDEDEDPIEDADVVITDNLTTTVISEDTDSEGEVEMILRETLENQSGNFSFNPYSIEVTKSGYFDSLTEFNITGDLSLEITLEAIEEEGNFTFTITSPTNMTYLKDDLYANETLRLTVTSVHNISSCDYDVGDTSGSLSEINPQKFQTYLDVSDMQGPYKLTFECTSVDDVTNESSVFFTVYPNRECMNSDDCNDNQKCSNKKCVDLECGCGYASNHACVNYECCEDSVCDSDEFCDTSTHTCEDVICDCPEKISNHRCNMDPGYCCNDLQCDENEACINHECIERTLSFTLPENIAVGQNISILVLDQNGDPVNNVGIDVKYLDTDPIEIEAYYTDSNGIAEIPIKYWGRTDFVARKEGYFTNSNSSDIPEPLNLLFIVEVIVLIGCLAGIAVIAFKFLKKGVGISIGFGGPLKLEKTVSGNRVMLKVKNTTGKKLQEVIINDSVPRGAFIRCNINPRVEPLDETTDMLTWEILQLNPREEVTIEYEARQAIKGFSAKFQGKEYKG